MFGHWRSVLCLRWSDSGTKPNLCAGHKIVYFHDVVVPACGGRNPARNRTSVRPGPAQNRVWGITSRTRQERWLSERFKSKARRIREQTVNVPKMMKQWNYRQSALDQALPHWGAGSKLKPASMVASHGAFIALRTQGVLRKVLVLNFLELISSSRSKTLDAKQSPR